MANSSPHGAYAGLKDKVVLITGASSGIGAGAAEVFAVHGSSLVLCGRNVGNLQATALKCEQLGLPSEKILQVPGDVTQKADLEATMAATIEKFGRLDVLVANAGIVVPLNEAGGFTEEDYDRQMDVNLKSVFFLIQLALPELRKTKGNIIAISSVAGMRPFPMCPGYCMSKAGMDMLINCLAVEEAPNGIRVNTVNPGMIFTSIFDSNPYVAKDGKADPDLVNAAASSTHPLGRCGNVYETGKAIAFLASDDASFITGVSLRVDGGVYHAMPKFQMATKE